MPAMVSVAAVELVSAHVPPLLASVIVTVPLEAVAVAEQCENPVGRVIVGVAGTVKAEGTVTVIVLPEARAPVEDVVKPTVQVEVALAAVLAGEKVTLEVEVAVILIPELGLTAVAS